MVVVAKGLAVDRQVVQLVTDPVRQHGQQHLAAAALPVDVEPPGVRRIGPLSQHLPQGPVQALGRRHGHVVRDDVQDQTEAVRAGRAGQRAQSLLAAEFGPHARVVDDVVPVLRARHGVEHG
ncbi:hypothetical protein GCM10010353_25320 [Streptomyces chryseus]|nr:hypothetical protein GCM10010353_25320 [Streptomyces chryseus]